MAKTVLNTNIFNADIDSHINTSTAAANEVLSYTGSDYDWVVQSGGIALTDLSVTTNSAGTAALTYSNSTGVFTYTPPDLSSYLTSEVNDLTASVTWANVPNANITESSVTQHQAALSITSTQVTDFSEAVDDEVSTLLQAGNGIDLDYDDVNNELTITSEVMEITAYNGTGSTLSKGTVVYQTGVQGTNISVAAATNTSASTMPAVGLVIADIANAGTGKIAVSGFVKQLDTSAFSAGDVLYVGTSGALTATKPTGQSALIQNFGRAIKINAASGEILISGAGRSNDTPNLNNGNVFIGNASNQAVARALVEADISDLQTYLTSYTETDTLDSVTGRGSSTTNNITVGNATITGNLTVQGTTTTLETATLSVEDKNITINYSTGDSSASADGAGITIQDAVNSTTDATILWDATGDKFEFSHAVDVTGNITVSGTVDGRDLATDGTKLDGIEANADVTDATNVAAAGAVMDGDFTANGFMKRTGAGTYTVDTNTYLTSISVGGLSDITVTNVADNEVLAYDSTSSTWINQTAAEAGLATSSQGTLADSALQPADLSVTTNSAGTAALSYSNGVFTYTPPDLSSYLTAETNDLTASVTWANVPNANITQSSVTQHQAALSITESQISDLGTYLTGITGENIGSLSDVTITSAAAGELLRYNGSAWVNSDPVAGRFSIINNASSAYVFTGSGTSSDSNPTLYLTRGQTYEFVVNASGHPFYIKTVSGTGTSNAYSDGVTNNGAATGTVTLTVQMDAPDTLYYNCSVHSAMAGTIYILDSTIALSDFSVTTNSAGTAALSYSNGVFTYTPPDLSSYLTGITGQSIENLSDVNTMTPTDGQVLTWDNANSRWDAASPSGGSYSDSSVDSHLNTSTATANQVLSWTGSDYDWVAQSGGGGGGASVTSSDTAPSSPSAGDLWYDTTTLRLYVYYNDGSSSQWVKANPSGSSGALVQESAPTNPAAGNLWFDPSTLETYVYYNDGDSNQWVQTNPAASSAGTTVYSSVDDLPLSGVETGAQAFVSSTSRLYLWNGTGWYNIALINTTPSISGASSAYTLATDGTATTVTITATDPEGLPITYSIVSDTSGNIATVAQGTGASSNVFTITPSTSAANAGTFSLTFRASDGVNIATAASSFTLQFQIPNSHYTHALVTSVGANNADNNDFVDSSTNSHTITASGDVTQNTFSPYRSGGHSLYFDGVNVMDLGFSTLNSGNWTFECWALCETGETILGKYNGGNQLEAFAISGTTGYMYTHTGVGVEAPTCNTDLRDGKWHYLVWERYNGTYYYWADGSAEASFANTEAPSGGGNWLMGGVASGRFKGYVKEARFSLSTAVYSGNAPTTPTEPQTTSNATDAFFTGVGTEIKDYSSNNRTFNTSTTQLRPSSPYDYEEYSSSSNGGSIAFDGTGDYLKVASSSTFNLYNTAFTIEGWFYATAPASAEHVFASYIDASNRESLYFSNSTTLNWWVNGSTRISATVTANKWYHVAIVDNGGTTTMYINGASEGTWTSSYTDGNRLAWIGTYNDAATATDSFTGFISDWRIVKGTAVYTSAFTPPTAPLTAITNTQLLVSGTNAGIIDKSQTINSMTLTGGTKSSTTQSKFLTSSIYFDGVDDMITFPRFNITAGEDFTIEFWHYLTARVDSYPAFFGNYTTWTTGTLQFFAGHGGSTTTQYQLAHNGSFPAINAGTVNYNQWVHVAIARYNGTITVYIDGSSIGTVASSVALDGNGTSFFVGRSSDSADGHIQGYLSDFRVTRGLARYTANFTPPTASLKG
jgi:hypothetical protein